MSPEVFSGHEEMERTTWDKSNRKNKVSMHAHTYCEQSWIKSGV